MLDKDCWRYFSDLTEPLYIIMHVCMACKHAVSEGLGMHLLYNVQNWVLHSMVKVVNTVKKLSKQTQYMSVPILTYLFLCHVQAVCMNISHKETEALVWYL